MAGDGDIAGGGAALVAEMEAVKARLAAVERACGIRVEAAEGGEVPPAAADAGAEADAMVAAAVAALVGGPEGAG